MARRKYHVGNRVPERWVFGMYDVQHKVGVLRFVEDRKQETLFPIIQVCLGVFMSVYLFRSMYFLEL